MSLEIALEPRFRAPFLRPHRRSKRSASFHGRLAAAGAHRGLLPRATLRPPSATVGRRLAFSTPSAAGCDSISPTRSANDVLFDAAADVRLEQPADHPTAGARGSTSSPSSTRRTGKINQFTGSTTRPSCSPIPLEACTSYRWQVHANMVNGPASDQITANSPGTFVIRPRNARPSRSSIRIFQTRSAAALQPNTCFWFDLAHRANVSSSTIYDLRGRDVRTIVPGPLGDGSFRSAPTAAQNSDTQTRMRYAARSGTGATTPGASCRRASTSPCFDADGLALAQSRSCSRVRDVRFTDARHRNDLAVGGAELRRLSARDARPPSAHRLRQRHHAPAGRAAARSGRRSRTSRSRIFTSTITATCRRSIFAWKYGFLPPRSRARRDHRTGGNGGRCSSDWPRRTASGSRRPDFRSRFARSRRRRAFELPGGVRLACHPVPHTPESVAYSMERGGRRIVYTGDTGPSERARRVGAGVRSARLRMFAADRDEHSGAPDP